MPATAGAAPRPAKGNPREARAAQAAIRTGAIVDGRDGAEPWARKTKTMIGSEPDAVFEDREIAGQWRVEKFDQEGGCDVRIFTGPTRPPPARSSTGCRKLAMAQARTPITR
jgi:hypothetical protein